jgi:hypothetical protein
MPTSKKPNKRKEPTYSFRAVAQLEDAIERHFDRLTKSAAPGVAIRKTDALASLLIVGSMAWDAADRLVATSPGSVIEAGEQALRNLNQSENDHE